MPVWSSVTRIETGIVTSPMPMKSSGRLKYIRQVALTVWPHDRRRARRSGVLGVPRRARAEPGDQDRERGEDAERERGVVREPADRFDPVSTAPQNEPVAAVPSTPPAGIP